MLFDHEALERIRATLSVHPDAEAGWREFAACMSLKDEAYAEEIHRKHRLLRERVREFGGNKSFTLGNHIRDISREASRLGFYFRMTGESQAVSLIREILRAACLEETWVYQPGSSRNSDLWTADIGVELALAFDAVRDELDDGERTDISRQLHEKAFLPLFEDWLDPLKRLHALDTMGHNWWMICAAGAGIVLLLAGEDWEDSETLLEMIAEGIEEWFRYPGNVLQNKQANFGPDGDYLEFMGYLDYSLHQYLLFAELYGKLAGKEIAAARDILPKLPRLYQAMVYPDGEKWAPLHFGDTGADPKNGFVWLYLASKIDGEMLAYFQRMKGQPTEPLELYFYPETPIPRSEAPAREDLLLRHTGIAVVRNSHQGEEIYFAIKTGEAWNHNHLDAGTFVLSVDGCEFAADSGSCVYSKSLYTDYYCSPRAHNVVLLEGEGIPLESRYTGTKFPGSVPVLLEGQSLKYLLADCTGPYAAVYERFYRHVLFSGGCIVMIDDLQTRRDGRLQWLLHARGEAAAGDGRITVDNGARLVVENVFPREKEYSLLSGYLHAGKEGEFPEGPVVQVEAVTEDKRIKFANVFLTPGEQRRGTAVEAGGDESCLVVRIRRTDRVEDIHINPAADGRVMHDNSLMRFGELETDGFIAGICTDYAGRVLRVNLHNGSFLRYRGCCLFSTLLKCDVIINYENGFSLDAELGADAWCHFLQDAHVPTEGGGRFAGLVRRKLSKGRNHVTMD